MNIEGISAMPGYGMSHVKWWSEEPGFDPRPPRLQGQSSGDPIPRQFVGTITGVVLGLVTTTEELLRQHEERLDFDRNVRL